MTDPLVQAAAVSVDWEGRLLLEDVDLTVTPGSIVTLLGSNGAGKTTLVKILLGLLTPTRGTVYRQPGMAVGYVPQRIFIDRSLPLTVARFLRLSRQPLAAIQRVLQEVGVLYLLHQSLHTVSGGEWQRVLLARALLRRPKLLVLDEPAQGVDTAGRAALYQLIASLRDRYGCGILMVSHDLHLVMASTDIVVCLHRHVCCSGRPEQVSHDPAYKALFGERHVDEFAVYQHSHNHHHHPSTKEE